MDMQLQWHLSMAPNEKINCAMDGYHLNYVTKSRYSFHIDCRYSVCMVTVYMRFRVHQHKRSLAPTMNNSWWLRWPMISWDGWSSIFLTFVDVKPQKNLKEENWPDQGSNPGPPGEEQQCYPLNIVMVCLALLATALEHCGGLSGFACNCHHSQSHDKQMAQFYHKVPKNALATNDFMRNYVYKIGL